MSSTMTVQGRENWEPLKSDGKHVGWRIPISYSSSGTPDASEEVSVPMNGILTRIEVVFGGTKPTNTTTIIKCFHPKSSSSGSDLLGGSGTIDTTNADYQIHVNTDKPAQMQIFGDMPLEVSGNSASGSSMTIYVEYLFP